MEAWSADGARVAIEPGQVVAEIERILRSTGLIVPAAEKAVGDIRITVNNFGDTQDAIAKGIGTGLTFGLAGQGNVITGSARTVIGRRSLPSVRRRQHAPKTIRRNRSG